MAQSLAAAHRPRRFAEVAGQQHVSAVLREAARRQAPPQQILLAGPSGLGKTTLARIFAAALFCQDRGKDGDACAACPSCDEITRAGGFHPDVVELDAASNGGKDEIRQIGERANLTPMRARWKVYIIDEAHGLTAPGGQAFLRLLEEPPAHVLFILATTDPQKLPTALRGRCMHFEVLRPSREEIRANLARICTARGWTLSPQALDAVVAATDPALGMRGTVMTLEKLTGTLEAGGEPTGEQLQDLLGCADPARLRALTEKIAAGDRPGALLELTELSARTGAAQLRRQLTEWAREALIAACRERVGAEEAYHRYQTLVTAGTGPGALEVAVARMTRPELHTDPQALVALLERAERLAAHTPPVPAEPAPARTKRAAPTTPVPEVPTRTGLAADVPVPPATPPSPPVPEGPVVPWSEAEAVALLNAVARVSPRATVLMRRGQLHRAGQGWVLVVPAEHAGTPAGSALAQALAEAPATVRLTYLS
jgi:DNA polymerase-3 subunit gamma/tau